MPHRLTICCFCLALALAARTPARGEPATSFALPNGLRVRLVPERDPGQVSMLLAVRAGMLNEGKGQPHLAHVTEHATVYDIADAQLAETVKQWFGQGKVNAETLGELMYFDVHCSRDELPTALAVQVARLGKMSYAAATLEREIPNALSEVEHLMKQPGGMGKFALVPFAQAALYGQTDVPLIRQTKKISVEDVRGFHDRWFRVDSAILVVVGDFDVVQTRKEIEKRFASIPKAKEALPARPLLKPGKRRVRWDVAKRHWLIAWQAPAAGDADYAAIFLAGQLLQERLFNSPGRPAPDSLLLVHNDFDRMLVVAGEAPNEDGFEVARKLVIGEVEKLNRPGGIDATAMRSLCNQLDEFQKTNLDNLPLPPGMTRTMARANIELQRLSVEIVAGDFDQFLKKLRAVSPEAAIAAVGKWLATDRACVVELVPEGDERGADR